MIKSNKPIRMDEYIPPLVAVTTGILVVGLCFFMRIPFFLVGVIAIALVIYGLNDHLMRFVSDYQHFSAPAFFKENAPVLMISIVILLSLGFLLLKFGPKAITTNQPTSMGYGSTAQQSGPMNFFSKWFSNKQPQQQQQQPEQRPYSRGYSRGYNYDYENDPLSLIRRT